MAEPPGVPERWSVAQVCRRIPGARGGATICPSTVGRWISTGVPARNGERVRLTAVRAGGRWLIAPADLEAFFAALALPDAQTPAPKRTARERGKAAARAASELERRGA